MKKELIVKDNALINASYSLELTEQRIILLAILKARENKTPHNQELIVTAQSYITAFNVHRNTAYKTLKTACDNLFTRQFTYQRYNSNGNVEVVKTRWVQSVIYAENESYIKIKFTDEILPLVTMLEKHFTSYELQQVSSLKSVHSIRLYELLIQYRTVGKIEISLDDLRLKLGINESEYPRMDNFKNRVLDVGIQQINEHSDITVKYNQVKTGRQITGFIFTFKQKPSKATAQQIKRDDTTGDLFSANGMSDKQIAVFSRKLSELPELGNFAPIGASAEQFAQIIGDELRNPLLQVKYIDYLKKLGFKSK
ncbi:initiator RepB protein [Enhydrobacter aerosaccus SK60]|nr:initiator RepB protein [Enhydrobacter aerosaccus SK60]